MNWNGQRGFYPANFIDSYGSMSHMSPGTSNSNSSESSGSVKDIERKKKEENKSKKKDDVVKSKLSTIFKGITKKEEKKIFEYATDKMEYHENLGTSLAFGTGLGLLLPNIGRLTQPCSAAKSAFSKNSVTNVVFQKAIKNGLWKENPKLLQDAFSAFNKMEIRANKWGVQTLFKGKLSRSGFDKCREIMEAAIETKNPEIIAGATELFRQGDKVKNGVLRSGFYNVKSNISGLFRRKQADCSQLVPNNPHISFNSRIDSLKDGAKTLLQTAESYKTFKGCLKNSIGGKIGVLFALTSLISEFKYIKAAFKKGKDDDGIKQLGQSVAKAASSWGGYVIGDALGKWGGVKLGAAIGTTICPALGTIIGAASGFVLGTITSWGLRKVTNSVVGDNIANPLLAKEEIDKLKCKDKNNKELVAQKESEQQQYLSNLLAQAQKDKNIDKSTMDALTKAVQAYAPLEQNPNLEQVA